MKNKKVYTLFFFLLLYIAIQSVWWMYSIYKLSSQLYSAQELDAKKWMIFGEGAVFLLILLLGFIFSVRTLKKDLNLSVQQKNFLMTVSHELKTPIASIKLYLQTLLKRDLEPEKRREILTKSLSDTERLNNLVESILLATKIDDHSLFMHKTDINLSQLVQETTLKLMESNTKKLDFEFFIEEEISLSADVNSMVSVVSNLVGNAIKYSPEKSTVTVTLIDKDTHLIFSVADQGKGIPQEEKNKIFNKFYRIGDENTRKEQGTGLGLFLVKYLVGQHNGTISVQKNPPKGAIFACKFNTIT
ncbi:MAG: two-component system phosphate regulon sensor histidine kinase PhoR [Saprospiraceae bacterium]|jgi:two-component system phosphate regulon sensor histidine kinase PhoR